MRMDGACTRFLGEWRGATTHPENMRSKITSTNILSTSVFIWHIHTTWTCVWNMITNSQKIQFTVQLPATWCTRRFRCVVVAGIFACTSRSPLVICTPPGTRTAVRGSSVCSAPEWGCFLWRYPNLGMNNKKETTRAHIACIAVCRRSWTSL